MEKTSVKDRLPDKCKDIFLLMGTFKKISPESILIPADPEKSLARSSSEEIRILPETPSPNCAGVPFLINCVSLVRYGLKADISPKKCPV